MPEDTLRQTVMDLREEFKEYKRENDNRVTEFKKETRGRLDKVEDKTLLLDSRMENIEKALNKIDDNTVWTKRVLLTTLLGGISTLIVTAVIFFVQN